MSAPTMARPVAPDPTAPPSPHPTTQDTARAFDTYPAGARPTEPAADGQRTARRAVAPARLRVPRTFPTAPAPWLPLLVTAAKEQVASVAGADGHPVLELDLARVPPTAGSADLVFLVGVLRRVLGPDVEIRLVGVTPALAAPLIGGLDHHATVVDTRGRHWPGRPDTVRPIGTWP